MESINPWLLLSISIVAGQIGSIARTYYCKLLVRSNRDYYMLNGVCSAVCALLLWAMGGFGKLACSPFSLSLGVLFGVVTMVQTLTNSAALHCGPWSYTTVLVSLSTIIPAISGALFWKESIGIFQIIGMVLLVACFILSVNTGHDDGHAASLRWLVLCLVAFVSNGAIGVMQKVHQSSIHKEELSAFLISAFVVSTLFSLVVYGVYPLFNRRPSGTPVQADHNENNSVLTTTRLSTGKILLIVALFVVIGITTAMIHSFNLYLSGVLPSAVFFPVVNGVSLLLVTLFSVVLFHEKLTLRQWIGLGIGTAAVLLLCL